MKKITTIISALVISLTSFTTEAQTVKDFYIPAPPKNKAKFYSSNQPKDTLVIYYVKEGNSCNITSMPAKPVWGNTTNTVTFSDREVKLTKYTRHAGPFNNGHNYEKESYDPPMVIFKLPPPGEDISWTPDPKNPENKVAASWTTTTVDGQKLKTVKVESTNRKLKAQSVSYYIQGMGLYKMESIHKGRSSAWILEKLTEDPNR